MPNQKEKVTLKKFIQELQYELEGYDIGLYDELQAVRNSYEIVDDEGNTIDNKIDWDDFNTHPFIEVSYDGDICLEEERVVRRLNTEIERFKKDYKDFWGMIKENKVTDYECKNQNPRGKSYVYWLKHLLWDRELIKTNADFYKEFKYDYEKFTDKQKEYVVENVDKAITDFNKFISTGGV